MNLLETALSWLTVAFELTLCGFVFARKAHRILPFFASYTYLLLTCTFLVWLTYTATGFTSLIAYRVFWTSTFFLAAGRSLAIAELCRFELRNYRGIWGLVSRVLLAVSFLFCVHAAVDAWDQPYGMSIFSATWNRDLAIASIAVLALMLLIRGYYGLGLNSLQRMIAAGLTFTCAIDAVGYTVFRSIMAGPLHSWFLQSQKALWSSLASQVRFVGDVWSAIHLFAFMVAIAIWCYSLAKPVVKEAAAPELLPAHIYREMAPAINLRLTAFNERLLELLKP